MGRRPWATPEQTAFLESKLPLLDEEKENHGLTPFYARVAVQFIERWASPIVPIPEERRAENLDPQAYANERRGAQIAEWFKKHRKHSVSSPQPKSLLDLTGKGARKPPPLQPYQAYSIRYHRPDGSPLRAEVKELWRDRKKQETIDKLSSFMINPTDFDSRMLFHNGVMRWKCSLLNEEEKLELQAWIDDEIAKRWADIQQPWKSLQTEGVDELTAENQYVQSLINTLPPTMQTALEEVERATGMKAILLMGGPVPAQDGNIGTHLYVTGQSRISNLTFSKSWEGFEKFYGAFVEWLRTTYSEEERSQRRGYSAHVTDTIPPRLHISDATAIPDTADHAVASVQDPSPASLTPKKPSQNPAHLSSNDALQRSPSGMILGDKQLPPSPTPIVEPSPISIVEDTFQLAGSTRHIPQPSPPPLADTNAECRSPPRPSCTTEDTPVTPQPPLPAADTRGASRPIPPPAVVTTSQQPSGDTLLPIHSELTHDDLGVFMFDTPSSFITSSTIRYWEIVPGGQCWIDMVKAYLRLEESPAPSGCPLRLPTTSRPTEVGMWMKTRLYTADRIPHVADANIYSKQWVLWWTACQPPWRQGQGWPLPREQHDSTKWGKLGARGQNGLFVVVMSTTWWAASLKTADDRCLFDEAVDDIRWVIERMLTSFSESSTTDAVQNPSHPQVRQNPSLPGDQIPTGPTATWMTRKEGKRQPKPSRALLEKMV